MTAGSFLGSRAPLQIGHAVAALLVLEDGRYIMQLRDDIASIWYPGHWGLFGGGVDDGEDEIAALRRELWEELELKVGEPRHFATLDYDLRPIGLDRYFRRYYEVAVSIAAWSRSVLHEGRRSCTHRRGGVVASPNISLRRLCVVSAPPSPSPEGLHLCAGTIGMMMMRSHNPSKNRRDVFRECHFERSGEARRRIA